MKRYEVLHHAVKLFALNSGESDDAFTMPRKEFTSTPCSWYSKMALSRSCSMDFNWPSGPAWAAFFLLFIMAMIGQAPPPARCCFFNLTISKWAMRSSSAAFRIVIPFSRCRRTCSVTVEAENPHCIPHPYWMYKKCFSTLKCCGWASLYRTITCAGGGDFEGKWGTAEPLWCCGVMVEASNPH